MLIFKLKRLEHNCKWSKLEQ